MSGSRRLSRG